MESQYSLRSGDDSEFTAMACRLAGRHLLNVLRSIGVQPDEIRTQAEALRQVWPAEWAYDAWCAWHACRVALRHLGIPEEEISTDSRTEWRTAAKFTEGPVLKPEDQEEAWSELRDATDEADAAAALEERLEAASDGGRAVRVLVADDEANVRKMCTITLELEGFGFLEAADGEDVMAAVRAERPDLVLLDVGMPRKDGWTCLQEIKADPELAGVKVIMLTGLDAEDDVRRASELQADGYVTKPFDGDDLIGMISRVLRKR